MIGKANLVVELALLPNAIPVEWSAEGWLNGSAVYRRRAGLLVFVSASREADGEVWLHVSASRRDRVPSYAELCECKRVFVGPNLIALQVHPVESEHFSLHPFCLHLWAPIGHSPIPDFRFQDGGV